jgi:hypothetical protein
MLDSLKQGARLYPGMAAVLGECKREQGGGVSVLTFAPVGAAEHRRNFENKRASLYFEKHRARLRSGLVVQIAGKPSGSPFFWVLFFGEAKKSTSPLRAKPADKKRTNLAREGRNKIHR